MLLDVLEQRAALMQRMVDEYSLTDANTRLARWLIAWILRHVELPGEQFQIVLPYTQSEIAGQVGTVREVISRGFAKLESEGVLSAAGKRVTVISFQRLRALAQE